MDIFLKSGIFGLLVVVIFVLLFLTGVIVVAITRSRRATIMFTLLAFLPLLLGLCGTSLGYLKVDQFVREHGHTLSSEGLHHPQSIIQVARREARLPTYLGLGATAALLIVFGCGFALTKNDVEQAESSNAR